MSSPLLNVVKRNLPSWRRSRERNLQDADHSSPPPGKGRGTQFGLKELAPGTNPDIDIVAIHGIDGDREASWTAYNGVLWLKDLLPDKIPNARILSYGYDANTHGQEQLATEYMHDLAMTFISKLVLFREETSTNNRAIIFVAHSSGGILLKSALIHSHLCHSGHLGHHHAISLSTHGVAFFSTPHLGSATAELARFLLDISSHSISSSNVLLRYIERDSEVLQQLVQYSAISGKYETKFFYELYDTPIAGRVPKRVVLKASAVVPGAINTEAIGIFKNHFNMVQYPSADDEDFRTVSTTLSLMAKAAHKKMIEKRYLPTTEITAKEIDLTPSQQSALANLPRVKAARFNAESRSPCLKGTRVDLLKTITEWTEQEASEEHLQIFWLCGQAGTGKTTISLTVAGDCPKHRLGATFFFSRGHAGRSELQLVFPTLAHQLGLFHKPFQVPLARAVEADPDITHMEPGYQFRKLIADPLKSCDSFPTSTIVVIDALDECGDKDPISKILAILSAHIHELPQLKFFITSRPEVHIREGFQPLRIQTQAFILHDIEASIVNTDIEHYLHHRFSVAKSRYPEIVTPGWPPDESIKALVGKSCGLFIFAATAMNFILDCNYDNPPSQLAILLGEPSAQIPSSPFAFLDQLYLQVLLQAFPSSTTPLHRLDLLKIILGTIVLLRNPLSLNPLESLLGLETGLVKNTLRRLHSVIVVPETDQHPIRLIHPSFFDFITTRCSNADFRINSLICHEQLAIGCFNQMKGLKRNICEIEDGSKLNTEIEDLAERIEQYISPAMKYACLHWPFHLCGASGNTLQGMLEAFCRGQILYWIEALSLLGYLREGIRHLQDVSKFLNTFSTPADYLPGVLADITRFMVDVFEPISCASLQLYRSALPLSPPSSFLYKTFPRELDGGMRVLQGEWLEKFSGITILRGSKGWITSVDISPNGALVASSSGHEVRLWDFGTGTLQQTLSVGEYSDVLWARFFPGGRIAGIFGETFSIWNIATGVCLQTIQLGGTHNDFREILPCFTVSPDFTSIVGSRYNSICIWATSNGDLLNTLSGHSKDVISVAFSPNQNLIASGSDDHTICLWNAISGAALRTLRGHSNSVKTIAFSPDNKYIVSGSMDHDIRLWDASSGVALKTLKGHTDFVGSVAFSPNGTHIISGSWDDTLRIWDVISGKLFKTIKCSGHVGNVGFLADGTQYISSMDNVIHIWDANQAYDLDPPEARTTTSVWFSPRKTYIYGYGTSSSHLNSDWHLWDGLTGTHLLSFQSRTHPSISPNDKHFLTDPNEGRHFCLWDIPSKRILWTIAMDSPYYKHRRIDSSFTFSLDSTRIAFSNDGLEIWDVTSGSKLFAIKTGSRPTAFSHDGSQIITKDGRYNLPPHVRPHPIPSVDVPLDRVQYLIKDEWVIASNGTKEERCVWIPPDWRYGFARSGHSVPCTFGHCGRVANASRRGLVLLDLSAIHLAI